MSAVASAPAVKFQLEWEEPDRNRLAARVWAHGPDRAHHIADLFYNGNEWLFIRYDATGEQIMDGFTYLPVDPEQEHEFREEHRQIVMAADSTLPVLLAELNGRRAIHRDEHRDFAEVGARIEARRWWPTFFSQL